MATPRVSVIMASSLDGFITRHQDGLVDWTSKEDKKHFVAMTKKAGVIVYGRKTFDLHGKPLPGRLNVIMTRKPQERASIPNALEFTANKPAALLADLGKRGYKQVMVAGGPEINHLFFQADLVDDLYITIEPKLFGGGKHLLPDRLYDIDLTLVDVSKLNANTLLLHYRVER